MAVARRSALMALVLALLMEYARHLVRAQGAAEQRRPFSQHTDCGSCVAAGYGWSERKHKCGGFAHKRCDRPGSGKAEVPQHLRPKLPHRLPHSAWLPRVTLSTLQSNATLSSGSLPFILTDSAATWRATQGSWNTSSLAAAYGTEQVDYYSHSLQNFFEDSGGKPTPLAQAVDEFDSSRDTDPSAIPYIIWRTTEASWKSLEPDISPLPSFFASQTSLLKECAAKGASSPEVHASRWADLFSLLSASEQ